MPIKILMPALSPTMTEGNLARWLKKEGDKVEPGEVIAEIETDKATMEVESVDEGVIGKIMVPAGSENIPVNSLIAVLLEEGETQEDLESFIKKASEGGSQVGEKAPPAPELKSENVTPHPVTSIEGPSELHSNATVRKFASPLAKRLAEQNNVQIASVQGTGPHGRVVKSDILSAIASGGVSKSGQVIRSSEEFRLVPNTNIRKIIAKRLLESKQTIPHFYLSIECSVDKLLEARADINASQAIIASGSKISVNDFVILAVAKALEEVPEANSSFDEAAIKYYNNVDVSVAVAIDGGLVTPIIKNANQKSIQKISSEMKDLAARAKENKLAPEEFQGGGFTISNLGMYGIKNFSAIVNPPQTCILAIGASSKRPVVKGDKLEIATIMDVTLSCDHRVVDGAVGANFLNAFKKYIEKPVLMFV